MTIDSFSQYGSMAVAAAALLIKIKGMKEYVPVGMFASLYANAWCFVAMNLNWWDFPARIIDKPEDISLPANMVVVPIIAMFWVRYAPLRLRELILWAFLWTTVLTGFEFLLERYTNVLKYHDGYAWYFSYLLWFASWFLWYGFHLWFYNGRRRFDSLGLFRENR